MPWNRPKSTAAQAILPVLGGLGVLAVLGLVLFGVAVLASRGSGDGSRLDVRLGDDEFDLGRADERAEEIGRNGPLLFPGLVDDVRGYIYVTHTGVDDLEGWAAFSAVAPGAPASCVLEWVASERRFRDPCSGASHPADGAGLRSFPVRIDGDDHVIIDLTPEGEPGRGPTTSAA